MKPKKLRRLMRHEVNQRADEVKALIREKADEERAMIANRIAPKPWWLPFKLWEFLLAKLLTDFNKLKGGDTNAKHD